MPRAKQPIYISDAKHWNDPTKAASRENAIISTYRQYFGNSIPTDHQYWTMCSHQEGTLCELNHLTQVGLIRPSQFRGVDIDQSVIEHNQVLYPHIWWKHGHFVDVIDEAIRQNDFRPAVINYDGVQQMRGGCDFLKSIMLQIDCSVNGAMLLVANFLLNNPYRRSNESIEAIDIVNRLIDIYNFPDHWRLEPEYYWYPGTGKHSNSKMGILIFVKSAHRELRFSRNRKLT